MTEDLELPLPEDPTPEQRARITLDLKRRACGYIPAVPRLIADAATTGELIMLATELRGYSALLTTWNIACGECADKVLLGAEEDLLTFAQDIEGLAAKFADNADDEGEAWKLDT